MAGPENRILRIAAALMLGLIAPAPARAETIQAQFETWLSTDLWPDERSRGISRQTFDEAFDGVSLDLKLPDLVLPGAEPAAPKAQHQAEFRSPGDYFAEKTVGGVVAGGRRHLGRFAATLSAVEKSYGVPPGIVLAIWGRESAFGTAKIPYDAFEVLGTKAFLSTRKDMFRKELLAALEMVHKGLAERAAMKSSWAGALGQPQFLPTSFLEHAVDGDGDGRRDIWNSQADTLASIANYLKAFGWEGGRGWGFEVDVPESVSCALEGPDRGRSFAQWTASGVVRVSQKPFPASETNEDGFLLMPAGRNGPAFLVTPNFYVLKKYNESDLYALFVGHGADRIAGSKAAFTRRWGKIDPLFRSDIAAIQKRLQALGHDVGGADGLPGYKTRRSIGAWQEKNGSPPTCFPSREVVAKIR